MNQFSVIGQKVGTRIGDTSATFLTTINQYINDRYFRIFKKFNWQTIVPAYSVTTVAGTQDYTLPTDFNHEMYVYDSTNYLDIPKLDLQELERINTSTLGQQGSVSRCAIYDSMDSTSPSPLIVKKIRLYQIPNSVIVLQVPYYKKGVTQSATTDLMILDMADLASELGATADAWRTKRQFAKAADFEVQYEKVIQEMIWAIENDPNRIVQFRPNTYRRDDLYGGDGSGYYYGY